MVSGFQKWIVYKEILLLSILPIKKLIWIRIEFILNEILYHHIRLEKKIWTSLFFILVNPLNLLFLENRYFRKAKKKTDIRLIYSFSIPSDWSD